MKRDHLKNTGDVIDVVVKEALSHSSNTVTTPRDENEFGNVVHDVLHQGVLHSTVVKVLFQLHVSVFFTHFR